VKPYERFSLGILAGGRASRLNNADKAFAFYQDKYLCQRISDSLDSVFQDKFISAREPDERFGAMNLQPVFDKRSPFSGPLAGIEALLEASGKDFVFTIPVDIKYLPMQLILEWLDNPERPGMLLRDGQGLQPLFALWHTASCLPTVRQALDKEQKAVNAVLSKLNFKIIDRTDIQIGNLNTPEDFRTL
jgi:molybdenum cofactor guanylyltransferase